MRIGILISMMLLIPFVLGTNIGGDIITIEHFNNCDELNINVNATLPIDVGEYTFINCTETSPNNWLCNCTDNYDLIMVTNLYAYNIYNITINYSYLYEQVETGSGGGSHRKTETIIVEPSIEINDSVSNQTGFVDWLQDDFIKKYRKEKNRQIKKPEQEEKKVENKTVIKQNETHIEEPPVEQKGFFAKVFNKIKAFFRWLF